MSGASWRVPAHAAEAMGWRDVTWLRMESPCNRMVIYWVLFLQQTPSRAQLHELVEQRLLVYPRFAQRLRRGHPWGHRWLPVSQMDPAYHLQERLLPRPVDAAAVEAHLAEWTPEPLDPERPLWQWRLLRSHGGPQAALIVRHHHCLTDGDGLIHMLRHLTDAEPVPQRAPVLSEPVRGRCRHAPPPALLGPAWRRWLGTGAQIVRLSLMRRDSHRHYRGRPGRSKRLLCGATLPLAQFKTIARHHGVTINDVWLGLVAGALRRHGLTLGQPLDDTQLRAAVTFNLRHREDAALMGNHFTLTALSLPTHLTDAAQRLRAVSERMQAIKNSCHPYATLALMTAMGGLPRLLQTWAMGLFTSKGSMVSTNLQGPGEPRYLAGVRVQEFHCWVPQTGRTGLGVMLTTYAGQAVMSVSCDVGLVPEPGRLMAALHEELESLSADAASALAAAA